MATATYEDISPMELVRGRLLSRTPERTAGIHTSDIIADLIACVPSLAKTLDLDADTRDTMFTLGLNWEDTVVEYTDWPAMQMETQDGIICSIDSFDPTTGRVHEAKCTWKTMRNFNILDQWRWMTQVKAYVFAVGGREASLWALHLNGDYRPPSPVVRRYDLTFDDRELQENYHMLNQHRVYMLERGWPNYPATTDVDAETEAGE